MKLKEEIMFHYQWAVYLLLAWMPLLEGAALIVNSNNRVYEGGTYDKVVI